MRALTVWLGILTLVLGPNVLAPQHVHEHAHDHDQESSHHESAPHAPCAACVVAHAPSEAPPAPPSLVDPAEREHDLPSVDAEALESRAAPTPTSRGPPTHS